MALDRRATTKSYEPVIGQEDEITPCDRNLRHDSTGLWDKFKAWYLFLLYTAACALLFVLMRGWIDDRDFTTGSPGFRITSNLYQSQITGLISLSLVLIRVLATACTALTVWRAVYIMLEQGGLTLSELVRINNFPLPTRPRRSRRGHWIWSIWFSLVVILSWPSGLAAPLVNSAIAWIPRTRLSSIPIVVSTQLVDGSVSWDWLPYPELCFKNLISAVSMAGKDPSYAFDSSDAPLRRYLSLETDLHQDSTISLTAPYLHIDLQWIDGADKFTFVHVSDAEYTDIVSTSLINRAIGSVAILRNSTWDFSAAIPDRSEIFHGDKVISVKVNGLDYRDRLSDGTIPNEETPCPAFSQALGKLPNVSQHESHFFASETNEWLGKDCYLMAKASITAGQYKAQNCTLDPTDKYHYTATCAEQLHQDKVEDDWISRLSLDFMSETMKYIAMQEISNSFMNTSIEVYTFGMLKLAHHAIWSSFTSRLSVHNESSIAFPSESVVRAKVDTVNLFIWLGFCSSTMIAAILVAVGQRFSSNKTVQDACLAALTIDLSDVAHRANTSGLCSAVKLSSEAKKLPPLVFVNDADTQNDPKCRRRLIFAKDRSHPHGHPTEI